MFDERRDHLVAKFRLIHHVPTEHTLVGLVRGDELRRVPAPGYTYMSTLDPETGVN